MRKEGKSEATIINVIISKCMREIERSVMVVIVVAIAC